MERKPGPYELVQIETFQALLQRDGGMLEVSSHSTHSPRLYEYPSDGASALNIQLDAVISLYRGAEQSPGKVGLTQHVGFQQAQIMVGPHLVYELGCRYCSNAYLVVMQKKHLAPIIA